MVSPSARSAGDSGSPVIADAVYIPHADDPEPSLGDFLEAVGGRFSVRVFDRDVPAAEQFSGARAVVDVGGLGSVEMITAAARSGVQLWQVLGVGLDQTHIEEIKTAGMSLAHTPGSVSAIALAETALMLMLALAKRLPAAQENVRAGRLEIPEGEELASRTLGLVGLGASARELARRAKALEMTVVAIDAAPLEPAIWRACGVDSFGPPEDLDDLLTSCEYVSLHVPLMAGTRSLIDGRRLELMGPNSCLINVARGALVDETALVEALSSGAIRGAGLDVTASEPLPRDHPLLGMSNVILTPHVAGSTRESSKRRGQVCAENVQRTLCGQPPEHQV